MDISSNLSWWQYSWVSKCAGFFVKTIFFCLFVPYSITQVYCGIWNIGIHEQFQSVAFSAFIPNIIRYNAKCQDNEVKYTRILPHAVASTTPLSPIFGNNATPGQHQASTKQQKTIEYSSKSGKLIIF